MYMLTYEAPTTTDYKGFGIDYNIYQQGEYSVQYHGDDFIFDTESEARAFIDGITA